MAQVFILLRFTPISPAPEKLKPKNLSFEDNLFIFRASNISKPLQGHTPGSSGGLAKAASLFFSPFFFKTSPVRA